MERISVIEFTGAQSAEQQVGRAVSALFMESSLLLPGFLRAQMEESILRALGEEDLGPPAPALPARTVQISIHVSDAPPAVSPRWGFFLVQKREAARLLLDVYLYQE